MEQSATVRTFFTVLSLLALVNLSSAAYADNKTAATQQLLTAFSASCPSQGQWTSNAIAQSTTLIDVLESVKKEPACQSVNGALTQLNSLSNRIAQMSSQAQAAQVNALKNQETSLFLQLSATTDPTLQYEIQTSLTTVEGSLTSAYLQNPQAANPALVETNTLTEFSSGTQVALSQLVQNQGCLLAHPELLTGIASLAGSVASASLSAGASLAVSAAVSVVNTVVEYVRENKLQRKINVFSDANAVAAYECALEAVSNNWCSAQDALNLISFKESSLSPAAVLARRNSGPNPFWAGVSLLDDDLPIFITWLNKVRSGNDPTTQPEADGQTSEFSQQQQVLAAKAEIAGIINGGQDLFDQKIQAGDLQGAWTQERTLIGKFINKVSTNPAAEQLGLSAQNPLTEIYSASCAPFIMLGLPQAKIPKDQNGGCVSFSAFDPFSSWQSLTGASFTPSLNAVSANTNNWIAAAEGTVDAELTKVLQADSRSIFEDARIPDQHGRSPQLAIQHLINFLNSQTDVGGYLSDTVARLTQVQSQITAVIANGGDPANTFSKAAIANIYKQMQLQYGPTLIQGRLQRALHASLNQLISSKNGIDLATGADLLASEDLISELQKISGQSNFYLLSSDLDKSQELSENTLKGFASTFGPALTTALSNYSQLAAIDAGSNKYKQSKSALCLMLMSVPEWPKEIPTNLCMGEQIPARIVGGPASIKIDSSTFALPPFETGLFIPRLRALHRHLPAVHEQSAMIYASNNSRSR